MAGTGPVTKRIQYPVPLGGILDESSTPRRVGDTGGNAAHSNLLYRRAGGWGVRPGALDAYAATAGTTAIPPPNPISGLRWYRQLPTKLTQLLLGAGSTLWTGANPNTAAPSNLTAQMVAGTVPTAPVTFAPVFDPVLNAEVVIFCGLSPNTAINTIGAGVFAGFLMGTVFAAGDVWTVKIVNGATTINIPYTITAADNIFSIAAALSALINSSAAAFTGATPTVSQATPFSRSNNGVQSAFIDMTALNSTIVGTYQINSTNALFGGVPAVATSLTTPGAVGATGPFKWDGTTVTQVSGPVNYVMFASSPVGSGPLGPPTGCVSWHNHVWYWGCAAAPNTLWASDINQPENASFMIQNGPYQIGQGDGDPGIQACVPIGNILYVFKTHSIYAITGYDFQPGEYQFNVQPAIQDSGIPSPACVAKLRDALVYWNGSSFRRLAPGALESEDIGLPIALSQGSFTPAGAAKFVYAIGGSFITLTDLADEFTAPATMTLNNCAYFAMSNNGTGMTTIMVYDDDASQALGGYAWASWTPPSSTTRVTSGFVAFGGGLDSTLTNIEPPELFLTGVNITGNRPALMQFGASARLDNTTPVSFSVTTGWITCGTPALVKELHQIYLEVQATAGVTIQVTARASVYTEQNQGPPDYPARTITLGTTRNSIGTAEQHQMLLGTYTPFLKGPAYQFVITWTGTPTAQCEILSLVLDFGEQNFTP